MAGNGELPLNHKLSRFQAAHGAPESKIKSIGACLRLSGAAAGQDSTKYGLTLRLPASHPAMLGPWPLG